MYRSYFFALFACAIFSCAALLNAYQNLPPVREIQVPEKIGSISSDTLPSSTAVPNTASKQECLGKDTQEHSPSTPLPTASPIGSSSPVTATVQSSSTPSRLFPGKSQRRET